PISVRDGCCSYSRVCDVRTGGGGVSTTANVEIIAEQIECQCGRRRQQRVGYGIERGRRRLSCGQPLFYDDLFQPDAEETEGTDAEQEQGPASERMGKVGADQATKVGWRCAIATMCRMRQRMGGGRGGQHHSV